MVKNGKTSCSVLYFPKLKELYYADETGAYCNGKLLDLLHAKKFTTPIIDQIYLEKEHDFYNELNKNIDASLKSRTVRKIYCAALSYCWIARGSIGGFVFAKDLPWDYTPGTFLVEKANGAVKNFEHNNKTYFVAAVDKKVLNILTQTIKNTQ